MLSTYPHRRAMKRRVIHIIHKISTKLFPKLSTQAFRQAKKLSTLWKTLSTYPHRRAMKRRVIHIIHKISTKFSPELSTLSRKTSSNQPGTQYLVILEALSTIYGGYPQSYPQFAAKTVKIAPFWWRNYNLALSLEPSGTKRASKVRKKRGNLR